jgi:RepB plasmid partitioning protein
MDDEAYTYNKRVNHAPPVAEHFMILKALSNGVGEERIAQVLNVDVSAIRQRRKMLDGICPEAVEILRNSDVTAGAFVALKKMKPIRQIEAAEHMHATGTYSVRFAQALLEVTHPEFLVETPSQRKSQIEATSAAAQGMLEQETDLLIRELKAVEASYGTDMLTLSISCGYVERLLSNARIADDMGISGCLHMSDRLRLGMIRAPAPLLPDSWHAMIQRRMVGRRPGQFLAELFQGFKRLRLRTQQTGMRRSIPTLQRPRSSRPFRSSIAMIRFAGNAIP